MTAANSQHDQKVAGRAVVAVVAILAICLLLFWISKSDQDYLFITEAEVMDPASYAFPAADAQWRKTPLPRSWIRDQSHDNDLRFAWYRMDLPPEAHTKGWSHILILRHMLNVEIWLDDRYLGSAGSVSQDRLQRNWNRPVRWTIPQSWVKDEDQVLYFRLHSERDFGVMSPIFLGSDQAIEQRYRINSFLQIELVKTGLMALFILSAISLFAWIRTRHARWLLTLLMCVSWSLPLSYIIIHSVPFGEYTFLRLSHWGTVAGAVCLLAFIYAFYLNAPLRNMRWLVLLPVIHGILLAVMPDNQIVNVGSAGQLVVQILFVTLIIKLLRHSQADRAHILAVVSGLVIMLLAALHDVTLVLSTTTERWRWDMLLSYITQPVMLLILTWLGLSTFTKSLELLKQLNSTLESKLITAENSIKQTYAEQELLEREFRIAAEREIVYRDLHDDLGAKLLSLVLKSAPGPGQDLARSALQDLRDIVSRVVADESLLVAALADSMAEHEGRANALAITFVWEIDDSLDELTSSSRFILNLRLFLREFFSNVLWRSGTKNIEFKAGVNRSGLLQLTLCHDAAVPVSISPLLRKRIAALDATLQQDTIAMEPATSPQWHRLIVVMSPETKTHPAL